MESQSAANDWIELVKDARRRLDNRHYDEWLTTVGLGSYAERVHVGRAILDAMGQDFGRTEIHFHTTSMPGIDMDVAARRLAKMLTRREGIEDARKQDPD